MKLKMIAEDSAKPTEAMVRNFEKRTQEHIDRVAKYLKHFYKVTDLGDELLERAKSHDKSKYGPEERGPYIWITEFYRCKNNGEPFEYPPGVQEQTKQASHHHVTTNRHHPEFHESPKDMSTIDIFEMVADWAAMAEELGEGSPRGWADKNIGSRWEFTDDQIANIYGAIEEIEYTFEHAKQPSE